MKVFLKMFPMQIDWTGMEMNFVTLVYGDRGHGHFDCVFITKAFVYFSSQVAQAVKALHREV